MTRLKHLPTLATIQHNIKYSGWTGVSGEHIAAICSPGEHIARPDPVNSWCCNNIGGFDLWDRVGYDYWFRNPQDAVLFRLRWG